MKPNDSIAGSPWGAIFRKLLFAATLLAATGAARADLEITISGGEATAQPIAVVPFAAAPGLTLDLAKVVDADLARTGSFRTLARADMLEQPTSPAAINFGNWRKVGMDMLVVGQVKRESDGRYSVRFHLMDTVRGQQVMAYDMPPAPAEQMRYIAHQIADLVYEKLTGVPGAFNTKIAYVTATGSNSANRKYQLVVADADGDSPHVVAISREPLMSPVWSPDRKQLAYVGFERGHSSIYLHTLATGQVRKLVSEKGINGSPAWSPDGRSMAVTLSFESNPDIYVIDIASGSRRRITDHYGIDTEAAWSPDGKTLVFTSDRGGQPQIYQVSASGGAAKRLTFEGKQNLRANYSPDGKSLVLVNADNGRYRIATLDLASGNLKVLTDGPLDESPSFSPNGVVIIYATQSGRGGAELGTVSIDGRVKQRFRQDGDVREPAWSPLAH